MIYPVDDDSFPRCCSRSISFVRARRKRTGKTAMGCRHRLFCLVRFGRRRLSSSTLRSFGSGSICSTTGGGDGDVAGRRDHSTNTDGGSSPGPAPTTPTPPVVVAMSGGVDSSVAAALLLKKKRRVRREQQHEAFRVVAGVHMTNWNRDDGGDEDDDGSDDRNNSNNEVCRNDRDWKDAEAAARCLGMPPLTRLYFDSEYWHGVFEPFLEDLVCRGRMGNPDVDCNRYVKFGALRRYVADKYGPDCWLATGHYARIWHGRRNGNDDDDNDDIRPPEYLQRTFELNPRLADLLLFSGTEEGRQRSSRGRRSSTTTATATSPSGGGDVTVLMAAADATKDQSYFLAGCSSTQHLSNVVFPLGDLYKKETRVAGGQQHQQQLSSNVFEGATTVFGVDGTRTVRQLARDFELPNADKRESMGICFVGNERGKFRSFVQGQRRQQRFAGEAENENTITTWSKPLQFVDVDTGEVVSELPPTTEEGTTQQSFAYGYTIGQGARIGGVSQKYFVTDLDVPGNRVFVCAGTHHPALYADVLYFPMKWVVDDRDTLASWNTLRELRVRSRIRHLQPLVDATLVLPGKGTTINSNNDGTGLAMLMFDRPVRGVTPGQMAVVYDYTGLVCLGGGPIERRGPTYREMNKPLPASEEGLHPAGHNDRSVVGRHTEQ